MGLRFQPQLQHQGTAPTAGSCRYPAPEENSLATADQENRQRRTPEPATPVPRHALGDRGRRHRGLRRLRACAGPADAMVSMSWKWELRSASHLKLLQLPGAGTDEIDFSRVPPGTAVCNCFEHEIGIAEYVLGAMLEWTIGLRRMDAQFRQGSWAGSYSVRAASTASCSARRWASSAIGRIGREVARRAQALRHARHCLHAHTGPRCRVRRSRRRHGALRRSAGRSRLHRRHGAAQRPDPRPVRSARFRRNAPQRSDHQRGARRDHRRAALYEALTERRIGGAVIDVWYHYPPQGQPQGRVPRPTHFTSWTTC